MRVLHNGSASAFQADGGSSILPTRSHVSVTQLVRVPPCHGGSRGFKSHQKRFATLTQ
jgi:hypothetical protein